MFEEAQKEGVSNRDDMRKLAVEEQQQLQKQAGEEIRSLTAEGYGAWYDAQSKMYQSTGKFFELPRNLSPGLEGSAVAAKAGLGRQAEFIDA